MVQAVKHLMNGFQYKYKEKQTLMVGADFNTERDSQTYKTNLRLPGGKDSQGLWEGHVHTAVFRMDDQQGPTVQHMELRSMLCASLDGRGVWGRMDTCIRMAESLHCSPVNITALLIQSVLVLNTHTHTHTHTHNRNKALTCSSTSHLLPAANYLSLNRPPCLSPALGVC